MDLRLQDSIHSTRGLSTSGRPSVELDNFILNSPNLCIQQTTKYFVYKTDQRSLITKLKSESIESSAMAIARVSPPVNKKISFDHESTTCHVGLLLGKELLCNKGKAITSSWMLQFYY
jgi:hypothetical protein